MHPHPASELADVLDKAVIHALNAWGSAWGLPSLTWRVVSMPGGLSVEGRPAADDERSVEACSSWARALEMKENATPLHEDVRTWFVDIAHWYVEISSDPWRRSGDFPSART